MRVLECERRKAGLSQAELGRRCGIDKGYMSKAERYGFAYPGHLARIAEQLGWEKDPAELLKEAEVIY